jgi:hypothetical protein
MGNLNDFLPSVNGLHFSNDTWPNEPDLKIAGIPIGNASKGLCGGMAFAVADLFAAGRLPPDGTENPPEGSGAFKFIVKRLIDSFNLPAGVAEYYEWMNLPTDNDDILGVIALVGTAQRTIDGQMPKLRRMIDHGHPCPLGLITVSSHNPMDLGQNHQVLAYKYEDDGSTTTVWIYDCDSPDDDNVTITFQTSNPSKAKFVDSTGMTVRGFFAVPYTPANPSPLF